MFANRWLVSGDLVSGLVVFLVALPLCLGIALASGAPLMAGIIAGIIGGIVVGYLSGSQISVSGPAAGLTAIVLTQLDQLQGNYQAFLLTLLIAGIFQILLSFFKLGSFANFVPSDVILGLLAAIGLILIFNQLPVIFGLEYELIQQHWRGNSALLWQYFDLGTASIGLLSIAIMIFWDRSRQLKKLQIPSALVAVIAAAGLNFIWQTMHSELAVDATHLVKLPQVWPDLGQLLMLPDFSYWNQSIIYTGALTLAIVASLETILNLDATDKLDPKKRVSPPNRELIAQGVGNSLSGLIGGLPITSVIVRSSVNVSHGAQTKFSAIFHGLLLLLAVLFLTPIINLIPISALAAILVLTGFKLASPRLFKTVYRKGWKQFIPFLVTTISILATDLLKGILIGVLASLIFILFNHFKHGIQVKRERHVHGSMTRITLSEQMSFLNRHTLVKALSKIKNHSTLIIDCTGAAVIDPDLKQLIDEFQHSAKQRHIHVKLMGFSDQEPLFERRVIETQPHLGIEVSTAAVQQKYTSKQVLEILKEGNKRFVNQKPINHDFALQIQVTSQTGQHPIAAVLGCMDSRAPTERIFDVGIGDLFSLRMSGNVAGVKTLGSLEFACKIKKAKLIVVLGHTDCGAVNMACELYEQHVDLTQFKDAPHAHYFIAPIMQAIKAVKQDKSNYRMNSNFVLSVTELNVRNTISYILEHSVVLKEMIENEELGIVGGVYDVHTGEVRFI